MLNELWDHAVIKDVEESHFGFAPAKKIVHNKSRCFFFEWDGWHPFLDLLWVSRYGEIDGTRLWAHVNHSHGNLVEDINTIKKAVFGIPGDEDHPGLVGDVDTLKSNVSNLKKACIKHAEIVVPDVEVAAGGIVEFDFPINMFDPAPALPPVVHATVRLDDGTLGYIDIQNSTITADKARLKVLQNPGGPAITYGMFVQVSYVAFQKAE